MQQLDSLSEAYDCASLSWWLIVLLFYAQGLMIRTVLTHYLLS